MSEETRREELQQVIRRLYTESLTVKFWRRIGRMFAWLPGMRRLELPLPVSSLVVISLGILVCSAIAWLGGAEDFFSPSNQTYVFASAVWVWLSVNISDWQIRRNIQTIQDNLPGLLELPDGENALMKWVGFVSRPRIQAAGTISLWLVMSILSVTNFRFDYSQAAAWILAAYLCLGVGWCAFFITWIAALIFFYGVSFSRLSLRLFQDHPSSTLPLLALHRAAGQLMLFAVLIGALLIPVGLITGRLTSAMVVITGVTMWVPLLAFYIALEGGFSRHIGNAKNKRLANLQEQISGLEQHGQAPDVKTAELIQRLLEIHDKVRRTPNSLVNVESLVNLFGSLALPLLGGLVKLYEILKQFLGLP